METENNSAWKDLPKDQKQKISSDFMAICQNCTEWAMKVRNMQGVWTDHISAAIDPEGGVVLMSKTKFGKIVIDTLARTAKLFDCEVRQFRTHNV